ncbi:PLP-dependent transferase [Xylona heveae TC161]|uniref:PLP-dependent transferase n=1 Tax=Xylona heveae (strain CBS 132557 / TC161) TaxID=1328760 RepID=A0A165A1B4_XYLHT|nr:PLP-dependent transferase [Xylona heveae TC161]KZF19815.1 PLP-dependent transferase [Xylona heveae TC161]
MTSAAEAFRPAARVAGQKQDVWSIVNEAAASSPVQPIVNMGQGFFGYNPPQFVIDAAKQSLDRVDCNQYAPTKGRPRLKKALADAYSPFYGRTLNPETEITITTGANEGMLSAFMAFIESGDEVIIFEPFFDQYISNIEMAGGVIKYVPMHPPVKGAIETSSASEWRIDIEELKKAITPKTKMIVLNTPHNPVGKVLSKEELEAIGELCVKNNILILSDEVYDRLYYVPFTRIATLSPELYNLTLTVGSGGKNFYATGWRVGWLIGPEHLIKYVSAAHTRICYSSVSPLQEATAIGFEEADKHGFWDESKKEMQGKVRKFNEIWDELGLPYSDPEGGYFVVVNMEKVKLPDDYVFPPHVAERPRDFKLSWFLIMEVGVAAIPPTEFYTKENAHIAENYLRFAVCKNDDVLEEAKARLRGLKKFIQA